MSDALAKLRGRRAPAVTSARSCDGCNVCCVALPIREFDKAPDAPCDKLCDGGCSIYPRRPKVCREFYCLWRMTEAWLPDWLEPSRCGFAISFNDLERWPAVVTVHPMPGVDPLASVWNQTVFTTMAEQWNCMVAIRSAPWTTHVITPTGSVLTPQTFPDLVQGRGVGIPDFLFGPDQRPLGVRLAETRFDWNLPPPPRPS